MRLLNVIPSAKYGIRVMARRTGEKGQMYGLIRLRSEAKGWQYANLNFPKEPLDQWVKLSAEFATPADLVESNVYLYNMTSEETVEYGGLQMEMLPNP